MKGKKEVRGEKESNEEREPIGKGEKRKEKIK